MQMQLVADFPHINPMIKGASCIKKVNDMKAKRCTKIQLKLKLSVKKADQLNVILHVFALYS